MSILDIDNHVAFKKYKKIDQICKTLYQTTPITYFCYQRVYFDDRYTLLPTHPSMVDYFWKNRLIQDLWLFSESARSISSGLYFWHMARLFSTPIQREIAHGVSKQIGLTEGIDIIERHHDFFDVYTFASNDLNIYKVSISFLRQFIFYFKKEGYLLCRNAWEEKLDVSFNLPSQNNFSLPPTTWDNNLYNNDSFNLDKYYLFSRSADTFLTKREIDCLRQMANGKTSKEAALLLGISYRTVDKHIENIKLRLECHSVREAIMIAHKENLLI